MINLGLIFLIVTVIYPLPLTKHVNNSAKHNKQSKLKQTIVNKKGGRDLILYKWFEVYL